MPALLENQPTKAFRFSAPRQQKFGVDRNQKILTGVALITAGLEAKGHGIYIDQKTIETGYDVLRPRGGRFKTAITHLSWADWWDGTTDRVLEFPGWFSGVKVAGNQLVADKLEFYDTFKADQPRLVERILEMAEKTPDLFGISLEPWGYLVFVDKNGVEYSERPKDVELVNDGLPTLRITDLSYGAIVDDPAANPGGIFAKLSRKLSAAASESEFVALFREMFGLKRDDPAVAPGGKTAAAANAVNSPALSSDSSSQTQTSVMKDLITAIKAEFGTNKVLFSRAMTIVGEKPEITLSDLKAEMKSIELTELTAQVTQLNAQIKERDTKITGLEKSVTDLTAERDDWKKKFTDLKGSGAEKEVNLGAGNSGANATAEENPFAPGPHYSLTRQAQITKQDPKLAAALKAAARAGNKTKA